MINAVSQFLQMCRNIRIKFLSWAYMYTTLNVFRQTCDWNKSVQIWWKVILRHIFVQLTFETRKTNKWFYVLRQGVPEGRSSEGYTSFKSVKPWPWHVEVIPGVGVVGLVTNKELCQVVWGIIIKNFMQREREREYLYSTKSCWLWCGA